MKVPQVTRLVRVLLLLLIILGLSIAVFEWTVWSLYLTPKHRREFAEIYASTSAKPRIAIVTWVTPDRISLYQSALNTKMCYAAKHGYQFFVETNMLETKRNIFWNKQRAVMKYLPYFDWVMWHDADTVIMNENIRLEEFVDASSHFIIDDHMGPFSAGVYMIRNSEWSRRFVQLWEAQDDLHSVWEDNGALYHALLRLDDNYNGECEAREIVSNHDALVECIQRELSQRVGPYGARKHSHVRYLSPFRAHRARGMCFWDREVIWPLELQYQDRDFMVHTKNTERYADDRLRTSCSA